MHWCVCDQKTGLTSIVRQKRVNQFEKMDAEMDKVATPLNEARKIVDGLNHYRSVLTEDECNFYCRWIRKQQWADVTSRAENRSVQHYGHASTFTNIDSKFMDAETLPMPDMLVELYNIVRFRLMCKKLRPTTHSETCSCGMKSADGVKSDDLCPSIETYNLTQGMNMASVYSYAPGQGIHSHLDSKNFEEEIVMLTISGTCTMTFDLPAHHMLDNSTLEQSTQSNSLDASIVKTILSYSVQKPVTNVNLFVMPGSVTILRGDARYKWRHGIPKRTSDPDDKGVLVERVGNRVSIVFRQRKY